MQRVDSCLACNLWQQGAHSCFGWPVHCMMLAMSLPGASLPRRLRLEVLWEGGTLSFPLCGPCVGCQLQHWETVRHQHQLMLKNPSATHNHSLGRVAYSDHWGESLRLPRIPHQAYFQASPALAAFCRAPALQAQSLT